MRQEGLPVSDASPIAGDEAPRAPAVDARLRELVEMHHDFIWRSLRRLGVAAADVDDGVQHVFMVAARKLASIRPGKERSFLFQTALRVASDSRRTRSRRREASADEEPTDRGPVGEDLLDLRRARAQMDEILDGMTSDLRAVFVLFELDEMTMAEIAVLLEIPAGTVASRLRRARAEFQAKAARFASERALAGGGQ
jgi:RNA polymerase sigma-70 factor (ECF subfamily)